MAEDQRRNSIEVGHETSDADIKPIVIFMVGLAVLIGISSLLMALLFAYFAGDRMGEGLEDRPRVRQEQIPPEPRLQTNPARELQQVQAMELQTLNRPAWVNRDAGIVRVPIERAMDLAIEKNLFPTQESQTAQQEDQQ